MASGQFKLLGERRFSPFFFTQFLGAFNDNLFKNALVILIAFQGSSWAMAEGGMSANVLVNVAAGLFILPFFLFSATAGQIADKYDKATLMRWIGACCRFIRAPRWSPQIVFCKARVAVSWRATIKTCNAAERDLRPNPSGQALFCGNPAF